MKQDNYYGLYQNINLVSYIIMYITLFFMLVRTDGRGLHDILANTIVKEEILPETNKEIIEVEEKPVKKSKTKKKETSTTKKQSPKKSTTSKKTKPSEK